MKAKEKAIDLVNKMWGGGFDGERCFSEDNYLGADDARECALICVDEILIIEKVIKENMFRFDATEYWNDVKIEINKL